MASRPLLGVSSSRSSSTPGPSFGGAVGVLGNALAARAEAKVNWTNARDMALATGQHWALPSGIHTVGSTTIIKAPTHIRYEPTNGFCSGVTRDGKVYSYTK